ncbi:MAG: helix-turn-helix transcriptional regulator [Alphaproteobacteria bacterium]|nr:helix-turn-helix transcriptional regulator [Alphaproteobacteria bacterium]
MTKTGFDSELLSENLQRLMQEHSDISAYALAKQAGVDKTNVQNIITGVNKNPGIQTLYAIADVLGCTMDALLGRKSVDAFLDMPVNDTFLDAAVKILKETLRDEKAQMTMSEWFDALKKVYASIASVDISKKDSQTEKKPSRKNA